MKRLVRWIFRGYFIEEFDRGYRAAVDKILLLPEKVRLGNTLELQGGLIQNCSFVGGAPAILVTEGFQGSLHLKDSDFRKYP